MRPPSLSLPLLFALAASDGGAQASRLTPLTRADVERFADSVLATYVKDSAEPSLGVVIVRGDTVLLAKGYGFERGSVSVSPDSTLFHIASVSKLFVAAAVMHLVEQRRLRLDDPVAKWVPELEIPPEVTVRQLLTHTSGIDAPFQPAVVEDAAKLQPLGAYIAQHPPRFGRPPGAEIRYSNHGMALAAYVVEKASGMPFDAYVEQRVFTPLGMLLTSIRQPPPDALADRVATAGAGPLSNYLLLYPAGAVVSTASDMGRFMSMLLSQGKTPGATILTPASVAEMQRRQWAARLDIPGVALGLFESDLGGLRALFHTGARSHFSLLYVLPEHGVGMFIVHSMRQGGPYQSLRTRFARSFVERYLAEPVDSNRFEPHSSQVFAGVYRPVLFSTTTVERAALLFADTRVVANADGSIDVQMPLGGRLHAVRERAAVFRVVNGDQAGVAIAFSDSLVAPRRMFLSGATQDPVSFDRLRWYQRGLLHAVLFFLAVAVIASYSFAIVASAIWRKLVRKPRQPRDSTWVSRIMRVASLGTALAPVAAIVTLIGTNGLSGPQRAVRVGVTLFFVASVVSLATIPVMIAALDRAQWSLTRRVHRWLFAISSIVIFIFALYCHVAPFWL